LKYYGFFLDDLCVKRKKYNFLMAHEPISNTDILLFRHLANREKVAVPDKVENLINVPDHADEFDHDDADSSDPEMDRFNQKQVLGGGGVFDSIVENELSRMNHHPSEPLGGARPPGPRSAQSAFGRYRPGAAAESPIRRMQNRQSQLVEDWGHDDAPSPQTRSYFRDDEEDEIRQKAARQFLMSELYRKQQQGVPLSMTMDEMRTQPLHVLKTENDLTNESQGSAESVARMRKGIQVFMRVCEYGNRKIGAPLPLDDWTDETFDSDPHIFDHSLERIHNLYFRNSYAHPLWELAQTLAVSGTCHCVEKYLNPGRSSSSSRSYQEDFTPLHTTAPPPPPPQQAHAFAPPPMQTAPPPPAAPRYEDMPQGPTQRRRRTLRPPFTTQTRSEPVSTLPTH
jgi:hypothetical protein